MDASDHPSESRDRPALPSLDAPKETGSRPLFRSIRPLAPEARFPFRKRHDVLGRGLLNAQANASPDMAPHYQTMRDLYERRLWHQLTMKLEEVVALPAFQTGDHLIQLYHNFIVDFEHKISPFKLGHLAVAVSSRYADRDAAAAFMENIVEKLVQGKQPGCEEPILYLRMHVALLRVHEGKAIEARDYITLEGKAALDAPSPDPSVSAAYYYVLSQYHKSKQDFAECLPRGHALPRDVSSESLRPDPTRPRGGPGPRRAVGRRSAHPPNSSRIPSGPPWTGARLRGWRISSGRSTTEICTRTMICA